MTTLATIAMAAILALFAVGLSFDARYAYRDWRRRRALEKYKRIVGWGEE